LSKITKTLYIPLEIFDREMGGGILLACEAVSRGWKVIIGGKKSIFNNLSRFREMPGVFFLKSIVPGETFIQKKLKSYGHKIASLDVEGLVPSVGEAGVKLRYSQESIDLSDLIFFWGNNHYKSVFDVFLNIKNKSYVSGSPIIDEILMRKKERKEKNKDCNKILIATSCGYANHMNGLEFSKRMTSNAFSDKINDTHRQKLQYEAELDLKIFKYWQIVIPFISARYKDYQIIVRPHPSENKDFWDRFTKNLTNVSVRQGGNILDEMVDANAFLHFNSTSSITALLLGIMPIMIFPNLPNEYIERITYAKDLSLLANTEQDLIDLINQSIKSYSNKVNQKVLYDYIHNINSVKNSAELIMDFVEERNKYLTQKAKLEKRTFKEFSVSHIKSMRFYSQVLLNKFLNLFFNWENSNWIPSNGIRNSKLKQPKINVEYLRTYMSKLGLEDYHSRVIKITNNLFLFS
jgi:surface carbohydrate biosynthesis protein